MRPNCQDSNARCMRTKSWPFWEDWKQIFGKDRAIGGTSEVIGKAVKNSVHEEHVADMDGRSDKNIRFDDVLVDDLLQETCGTDHGCDNGDTLLKLLGKLNAETNARLETLSMRIGYEMDLGKAQQNVFNQLGSIPALSEEQRYDLCDIVGKDNSILEIFMGLPEPSKLGYVMRILKKEGLI
ncbi:hypothetical protein AAHA92_02919 [Salvia divinorum]|uniref:Uncharacterized protein n=1 Tax=Salvia divinorum TaxID=28513 RepID=A0ABD1IG89_SALDI